MVLGGLSTIWALQPKELEEWFASSSGLAMSPSDAQQEATRSWNPLAKCGVEISTLQALRDALHDSSSLDLSLEVIRKQIIELAEQHIKADKLKQLYGALSGVYTLSGGLQLPKAEAQAMTHLLALKRAEPDDLKELYKVMYGYYGLGFDRALAQAQSIQLAEAGADAASYKETFSATVQKGQQAALIEASKVSVAKNLNGFVQRYALDGKAYTASEFQQYYGEGWLSAWIESPVEKRLSTDRRAYTADQFSRHFGRSWASLYQSRPEATQLRLAEDDQVYKMAEYQKYYGDQWHEKWSASPELACQECSPYTTRVSTSVVAV